MASTIILSDNGASSGSAGLKQTAGNDGVLILQTTTSGGTATTALTIDTSQNVTLAKGISNGLNVSGAGWGVLPYTSNSLVIDNNAGQTRFFATGDASNFGSYIWYGGKTGGSTSTYMTMNSSGQLGINCTPSYMLDVYRSTAGAWAHFAGVNTSEGSEIYLGTDSSDNPNIVYLAANNTTGSMRLDFRMGGTSSSYTVGCFDNSGTFLVGRTSGVGSEKFGVYQTISDWCMVSTTNYAGTYYGIRQNSNSVQNNATSIIYDGLDGGSLRFRVYANGGIANFSANNSNLSDIREKKDVELAGSYLAKICAIPVKTFLYNDQTDTDKNLGVIAQDVQAVAPELVAETDWAGEGEAPKMRLSIYQTDLQYALMKCIQELKAELDTAKEQIAILQGAQQ